jgi:16S rRNA (adenine1518-N6/adenine1519-N6)-dimethyltransferase
MKQTPRPAESTVRAKKSLGQNFLADPAALSKIVNAADLQPADFVVEIGPGLGALTSLLVKKSGRVQAVELDQSLIPPLTRNLRQPDGSIPPNLQILHGDALKFPLPSHPYKLVANIPYYITSPILNHFLQPKRPAERRPGLIVLLVQKEVAEKVCAGPGDHSVLSLQVQVFGKPELLAKVGKNCFYPPPKVDSAILRITPYGEPLIPDTARFLRLIHAAFSQRRKTLLNSLGNGLNLPKEKIAELLAKAGIKPSARPQELDIADWRNITEKFPSLPSSVLPKDSLLAGQEGTL